MAGIHCEVAVVCEVRVLLVHNRSEDSINQIREHAEGVARRAVHDALTSPPEGSNIIKCEVSATCAKRVIAD